MSGKRSRRVSPWGCALARTGKSSASEAAIQNDLRTEAPFREQFSPGDVLRPFRGKVAGRRIGSPREQQGLGRIGEDDPQGLELPQQPQVDGLLPVHEGPVVGSEDPIDGLEVEGPRAEALEV